MALKPAPQLVHVARANAVVQASDDAIATVRQRLAVLQQSAQPLRDQVAALEAEAAAKLVSGAAWSTHGSENWLVRCRHPEISPEYSVPVGPEKATG